MSRIELRNVQVSFKQEQRQIDAVKDVSLTIESRDIFGIVGLSGAGKSTLVRTINLLQRPTSGQILIDGTDIVQQKGASLNQIRSKIGMIFQHFNLIHNRTISQNIEFALKATNYPKEKRQARIQELLKLVDLSDKINDYPSNLSGGQKQRIGIARALANNPEILLCDEATSALDVETTEEILTILRRINHDLGLTIVFITHEMEVAKKLFNKIAVMEKGEIVELENTYDLFANPKSPITKKLVGRYLNLSIPEELLKSFDTGRLLELRYQGANTLDPLISKISKDFDVFISIVHGKIEYIQDKAIGILIIHLTGEAEEIKKAEQIISENVSHVKILNKEENNQ